MPDQDLSEAAAVHWRPTDGCVGDVIPFSHAGRIWLYYLLDRRPDDPAAEDTGMPWALVSTTDFVHYTDHGVVLEAGGRDAEDFDCYTGSVIATDGKLHLFYTGHNPRRRTEQGDDQVICHAISSGDPTKWIKHPELTFGAVPGYRRSDWRDPYVYRVSSDQPWQMILAARTVDGPDRRSGVVARLTSTDLMHWTIHEPLWRPHRYLTQECPDMFRWGEWWYLIYSEFTDSFQTRYRIARTPEGPWLAPERDTIDGRAFYAAKSVGHSGRRFVIGWIATKQGESDSGPWQWGGNLAALEARQERDGTLAFTLPAEVVNSFDSRPVNLTPLDGAAAEPGAGAGDRYSCWMAGALPDRCLITAAVDVAWATQSFGLLLHATADGEEATVLRLEPTRNRIVVDRWPRRRFGLEQWQASGDVPHEVELERPCPLPPGRHTLRVLLDDSSCQVVVDDRVALSLRTYDRPGDQLGLFVTDGTIAVREFVIGTRNSGSFQYRDS